MPLNVFSFSATAIILLACIVVTNSIKCYQYGPGDKTDTSTTVDCNGGLKNSQQTLNSMFPNMNFNTNQNTFKHCARMHGYADGKYFVYGTCGHCGSIPGGIKTASVTCSSCTSDECNSASRKGSVSPAATISLAACLLWLLSFIAF
ncbi:hypothetical protein BOX15_Mlig012521g2 [Macrostomum lignano]|uniref:Uncharacterized protein n=1 Tax=Macrostomum lignano TaxID=282301 RepID=A0A267GQY4_9PLAT|nr:hypothetical protein BOX15_Mlig012521g1 [Macrostomum lignano]PAA88445.1 hypothetical protein BOX15_Mlig012521g2 [Macrostomum lignano]